MPLTLFSVDPSNAVDIERRLTEELVKELPQMVALFRVRLPHL